jgi:salicylate hydroxylase
VAIVGGGIGGLAAASALRRHNIEVRVYEQADALSEVGAGIALQPNGIRALRQLGLADDVARRGARWVDPQFRHADGSYAASMWPPEIIGTIGFYGMHRADLLEMLLSRLPGDIAKTGHRCIGFEQDDAGAVIYFANGAHAQADVVVAADGIYSALQQFVVAPSAPLPSGSIAYRGVASAASVAWPQGAMRYWLGAGKHFLAYPVRAGELINYVGFVRTDEEMKESWSAPGDPRVLAAEFAGWDPMIGAIIAQIGKTFRWGLYDREPLPTWTRGRLALLGDAAHPMLQYFAQGACQAMEDAVCLSHMLSQHDAHAAALEAYRAQRFPRTARVQMLSRAIGEHIYHPSGEHARIRNAIMSSKTQEEYFGDLTWLYGGSGLAG